jgi:hypothetical protein
VVCSNDLSLERKKTKGVRTIRRMLEGAESEGCWRVQNPSSIKEKPKVGQLKCIMTYIMRYLFVYDILLQFLSSPYQSSPLKGPVSRAMAALY